MREAAVESLPQDLQAVVDAAQHERVVLTKKGKPVAMVVGIEGKDEEDLAYESSPEFWKMIEARRRETGGVPLEEIEARLRAAGTAHRRTPARRQRKSA
jgi:prevent-host-death family protein